MTTIDIILFCYKQEQYIRQAVESVLNQEYPEGAKVRIVVADDASPDNTLAVIHEVLDSLPTTHYPLHPDVVYLPEEPNMGISKNYKRSFAATSAEYVFILEGDDYWTSGHVMQHIAFLQAHPDYSMSMGSITYLMESTGEMRGGWWPYSEEFLAVDLRQQIEEGNQLCNLSACAFRGQYLRELPNTIFDIPIADWMLGVMMAQRGCIGILKESTSVYRYKSSGVWAGQSQWQKTYQLLSYSRMYDRVQDGRYHTMWQKYRRKVLHDACVHWTKFLPMGVQQIIHRIKKKNN